MPARRFDPELLRKIVIDAVRRSACENDNCLHANHFSDAMRDAYGLKASPKPAWCDQVLSGLPYVRRAVGRQTWTYVGEKICREEEAWVA